MRISDTSDSLIEYARQLLALAGQEGAEEAEVFGVLGRSVDIDLRKNVVELASQSFHRGLGLRATVMGAVGFSSTSDMNLLASVASSAVRAARARGSDESWRSLPFPIRLFGQRASSMRDWRESDQRNVSTWQRACCRAVPGLGEPSLSPGAWFALWAPVLL